MDIVRGNSCLDTPRRESFKNSMAHLTHVGLCEVFPNVTPHNDPFFELDMFRHKE